MLADNLTSASESPSASAFRSTGNSASLLEASDSGASAVRNFVTIWSAIVALQSVYGFALSSASSPGPTVIAFCATLAALGLVLVRLVSDEVLESLGGGVWAVAVGWVFLVQVLYVGLLQDPIHSLVLAFLIADVARLGWSSAQFAGFAVGVLLVWLVIAVPAAEFALWGPSFIGMLVVAVASTAVNRHRWDCSQARRESVDRERQLAEQEAEQHAAVAAKHRLNELAIRAANDGHWVWDLKTDSFYYSQQWAAMLGFEPAELPPDPESWFQRLHPHYLPELKRDLAAHLYGGTDRLESQYRIQRRDGSFIWVLCRGRASRDDQGDPVTLAGSQTEITHLVTTEREILDEAFRDRLTGLANRKAFSVRLTGAFARPPAERGLFAVIFMDLDRFKMINDTHGHLIGDKLLAAAASRLKNCTRQGVGDVLARFGGDEFVALLEDIQEPQDALRVAERFRECLGPPFRIEDHELQTGVSIGIAFNDTNLDRSEDLLRNADTAMYRAKEGRGSKVQVFNEEMFNSARRTFSIESDLGRALDREEFSLVYQPVVDLESCAIVGAEALLRWNRPGTEPVGPDEFIPIAEETGAIDEIGQWVLEQACIQHVKWSRAGLPPTRIAVNLSPRQLIQPGLPEAVEHVIRSTGVLPANLELELTETALIENIEEASAMIIALRALGVRLSIDDFGTGYSSLGYLRRFSFDRLKMDRSFVADLTTDSKSKAVAQGLIALAHNLGLQVTAEGVETLEQAEFLRLNGCDQCQGYLAARPLPPADFEELARRRDPFPQLLSTDAASQLRESAVAFVAR